MFAFHQDPSTGQVHQVWYDNVDSLTIKYDYAIMKDMRGVGMWTADSIDYTNTTTGQQQRAAMWGALPNWGHK